MKALAGKDMEKTILIVDDDLFITKLHSVLFQKQRFLTVTASSGEEAIEYVRSREPVDLVVMDLELGEGMDGADAAVLIQSVRDIPVLFMSAYTSPEILGKTEKACSYGFVAKESGGEILFATVKMALRLHEEHMRRQEWEARYRQIVETASEGILMFDPSFTITFANEQMASMLGYSVDEIVGRQIESFAHNSEGDITARQAGDFRRHERRFVRGNGSDCWCIVSGQALRDAAGRLTGSFALFTDITARKKLETILGKTNDELQIFRKIIESSEEAIAVSEPGGGLIYVNPAHERLFGRTLEEAQQLNYRDYYPPESVEVLDTCVAPALARGESWEGELEAFDAGGRRFFLWERAGASMNSSGALQFCFGLMHDVTGKKMQEEQIRASLREKESLIKEIHHRVKNNLAMVINLLSLQSMQFHEPHLREAFRESQNRIQSIAMIHEELYRSGTLADVNFRECLSRVISILFSTFGRPGISHTLTAVDTPVPPATALPLALLVNELVTNSLKYAFPGSREGTVTVDLAVSGEHDMTLIVQDNGIGLPEGMDVRKSRSLGLQLVDSFVRQLRGTLEYVHGLGAKFLITFRIKS